MSGLWSLLVAALVLFSAVTARGMPGAWTKGGKDNAELMEAMNFAIAQYNEKSNDEFARKIISVIRARQQLVAGMNYEAQVETGQTTCKNPVANLNECPLQESPEMLKSTKCTFQVYSVPWENKMEVTKSVCKQCSAHQSVTGSGTDPIPI